MTGLVAFGGASGLLSGRPVALLPEAHWKSAPGFLIFAASPDCAVG